MRKKRADLPAGEDARSQREYKERRRLGLPNRKRGPAPKELGLTQKDYQKRWNEKNKDRKHEYQLKYWAENKKKLIAQHQEWSSKNRPHLNSKSRERYKNDPQFFLMTRIRTRQRRALMFACANKYSNTLKSMGCSGPELVKHIESQFAEGMFWDNRELWHIDHIFPLSRFDLTREDHQEVALHYSNLKPMWGEDNIVKSDSLPSSIPDGLSERLMSIGITPPYRSAAAIW